MKNTSRKHPRSQNLLGRKFRRLTVVRYIDQNGRTQWECKCDCGKTTVVRTSRLVTGETKSCGCLQRELLIKQATTHGHSRRIAGKKKTPTYRSWESMRNRCLNPNADNFAKYGGRGITVCDRWLRSFVAFIEDMGERPTGTTLDRIDNSQGYCKENCRWASPTQQSRNARKNRLLTFNGKTQSVAEWAEELDVNIHTLRSRLNQGWSSARALTDRRWASPTRQSRNARKNRLLTFNGKTQSVAEWAEELDVNIHTLRSRLNQGWSSARALTDRPTNGSRLRRLSPSSK